MQAWGSMEKDPWLVFIIFFKLIFIGVELLYNIVLVSTVQQSESAIRIHISPLFGFPSHLGHHGALSRVPCAIR